MVHAKPQSLEALKEKLIAFCAWRLGEKKIISRKAAKPQ
jgi:hypothetical protein